MKKEDCHIWTTTFNGADYRVILSKQTNHIFGIQKFERVDDPFDEIVPPLWQWRWVAFTDRDVPWVMSNVLHQLVDKEGVKQ